jgi:hypothetical protein
MDSKTLIGIIGSVVSLVIGTGTMVTKLNKQNKAIKTAEEQVGSLGDYYYYVRSLPVIVMWWGLLMLCILGFVIVVGGFAEIVPINALQFLSTLFGYWVVIPVGVLFFSGCAIFDLPTRVLLFVSRALDGKTQFKPGYINATWQLVDPEESKAMNIGPNQCETLGVAILNQMLTETTAPVERAPVPSGVANEELANYLYFGCVIEHHVHVLINDKSKLKAMWLYMSWIASSTQRPFTPANVREHSSGEGFFEFLQDAGKSEDPESPKGQLPDLPSIKSAVDEAARWLEAEWAGDASKLATSNIFGRPSAETLLDNLEQVDPFSKSESIRRLYLKLSARMKVWPQMDPGPFLYPFYDGIALLLLNAGCIVVSDEKKRIDPDPGFRALVALAEDKVARSALTQFRNQHEAPAVEAFSTSAFNCAPDALDEWIFLDYIDLWMFTHSRQNCTAKTVENEPSPCTLKSTDATCFCITPKVEWWYDRPALVRA